MKKLLMIAVLVGAWGFCSTAHAATFTITVPDDLVQDLIRAFAEVFKYQETIANPDYDPEDPESPSNPTQIPNPESKKAFAKRHIKRMISDVYLAYKANKAADEARKTALEQAQSDSEVISVE